MGIEKDVEMLRPIAEACKRFGWAIAVPKTVGVGHLIIGNEREIDGVVSSCDTEYTIMVPVEETVH